MSKSHEMKPLQYRKLMAKRLDVCSQTTCPKCEAKPGTRNLVRTEKRDETTQRTRRPLDTMANIVSPDVTAYRFQARTPRVSKPKEFQDVQKQ